MERLPLLESKVAHEPGQGGAGFFSAEATECALGRGLAELHTRGASRVFTAGATAFGRPDGRPTGSRQLPNDPCPTWAEFYRSRRLIPLAQLASRGGALPPEVTRPPVSAIASSTWR